ncbi:MAG: aldo/keto reductase [Alphaproteobacteria bacterium]|nr:aldo/keto reductase [Alphaproteobacteria bacterium]
MNSTIPVGETEVPRIGLGTLYITIERGFGAARADAVALLEEAARLGVSFFDTADSYGSGSAEEALRQALHPYDGLIITTKGGFRHERLGTWVPDALPERLRSVLEGSLRRLGLDRIELYQLHCPDRRVPYAESVGTLADLQTEGKIQHIGVSNVDLRQLEIARGEAEIVSVQNPYNVRHQWDTDVLDYCTRNDIIFIPWMPLGDGGISWDDPMLRRLATKHGATPAQIALAALLHRSPVILPIPGTSSIEHLRENVTAGGLPLDAEDLAELWPDRRGGL